MASGTQTSSKDGIIQATNPAWTPENSIWRDAPLGSNLYDPGVGMLYDNDFFVYAAADWTITGEVGYTIVSADVAGGALLLTTDGDDNDGLELQLGTGANGEAFQCLPGKPLWFETTLTLGSVALPDVVFGLIATDTDIIEDDGNFTVTDGLFFGMENDGNLDYYAEAATSETTGDTGIDLIATTYNRFGIKWDGITTAGFYVDGLLVASSTTNIPTALMRPSYALKNTTGAANTMTINRLTAFAVR